MNKFVCQECFAPLQWEKRQCSGVMQLSGKGIDGGVAAMVQQRFKPDPFTNTLFLFCGRRRDCIKEFCRDRDGCILLYKL